MSNLISFKKIKIMYYFIGIPLIGKTIQRSLTRDLILTHEIISSFMICSDTILKNLDKFPISAFFIEKIKQEINSECIKAEVNIILFEKTFSKAVVVIHTKRAAL